MQRTATPCTPVRFRLQPPFPGFSLLIFFHWLNCFISPVFVSPQLCRYKAEQGSQNSFASTLLSGSGCCSVALLFCPGCVAEYCLDTLKGACWLIYAHVFC